MALGSKKEGKDPLTPRGGRALASRLEGQARRFASEHESQTARQFGGSVQRGSGSTERHKGDVKLRDFLVENKTRLPDSKDAGSIRIKGDWLVKITGEARAVGKDPALDFQIPGITDPLTENRWVAVPASVFQAMLEAMGR